MKTKVWILAVLLVGFGAVGCSEPTIATQRSLGAVDYADAFAVAEGTFSQHFTIERANRATGLIASRPEEIDPVPEGLLSRSATRRLASLQLDKRDGEVVARLSIEVQRQRRELYRRMQMDADNYDTVPNRTPAESEAATTFEQNETWETQHYDRALEAEILEQLYNALHGQTP